MDAVHIKKRVNAIRKQMHEKKLDGLIVIGCENIRYLTNFTGHDSWVLVLPRAVVLITDSRYTEQAKGECIGCKIVQRAGGISKEADKILSQIKGIQNVGIEDTCSVGMLKGVRKDLSVKVTPVKGIVEKPRRIKTEAEVKLIQKASRIAFDAMDRALSKLKPGMTERQLCALYEYAISDYNDARVGFDTIVCFGPNGSRNHHQPGGRKLRKRDTILVDFGVNYKGYISDTTRSFAFGKVTPHFRKVYETVARAQAAAIATIRAGVRGCDVDAAAREIIRQSGLPVYGHGTGHGIGLQVHENPFMSAVDKKTRLEAGQVITVEPGIYLPGDLGVRLEDDVLVTEKGGQLVSRDRRYDIHPETVPLL